MNVILPEKPKIINRRNVAYLTIFVVCTVAIAIAMYQFFSDEKLGVIVGITENENEEYDILKTEFYNLFTNKLEVDEQIQDIKKVEHDEEIVYTSYEKEEKSLNNYTIDVKLPCINIDNNLTKGYNDDIKKNFQKPAEDIMRTEGRNIIYTVNYMACVENDILSIAILSSFKDGNNTQRTILKTYNYNISSNKEATIKDCIGIKGINENTLENKIRTEIEKSQQQAEQLKELGYDIFARDVNDEMYRTNNIKNFILYKGYIYIVFPYGNRNDTSEVDIVIL